MPEQEIARVVADVRRKYGIGPGPFTEADCRRICAGERIALATGPEYKKFATELELNGCILTLPDGSSTIYLKSFFLGPIDVAAWAHELGHKFLGHAGESPALALATDRTDCPSERDAEIFAAFAMCRGP